MPIISKCVNCAKSLTKKTPGLECGSCGRVVHANQTCSGLSGKQLTALRNADSIGWTCEECQCDSPHRKSSFIIPDEEEEEVEVFSGGKSGNCTIDNTTFLNEITAEMKKVLKKELQPIEMSIGVCCSKIDNLTKTVEWHSKEITDLSVKYTQLKNEQVYLQREINSLKQYVRNIDQQRMDNVIELSGLPKLPGENIHDVSCRLSQILNMTKAEIVFVKRIDRRNGRDGIIQLGLQQAQQAQMWVTAARKIPVFVEDIATGAPPAVAKLRVMVRRALTTANKSLLWNAQQKLRSTYKYVWFQDGKVLVRRDENAKPLVARSEEDIQHLANQTDRDT